jgi:hypothetical protein
MKPESISSIKNELQHISPDRLIAICLRLAKYKAENKELLNYLLFQSHDEEQYITSAKKEIDEQFSTLNKSNVYLAKKTVRKVLKTTRKYIKFSGANTTELELLVYFCRKLKGAGLPLRKNGVLGNMYLSQFDRITKVYSSLHEDLQLDYASEIEKIR